jgi:pyruvate kinase
MSDASPDPSATLAALDACRDHVLRRGDGLLASWSARLPDRDRSASVRNLAHYLALRELDLRDLQRDLSLLGLSSLGRAEARVLANLDAIRASLGAVVGDAEIAAARPASAAMTAGARRLEHALDALAGPPRGGRRTRILVTLPNDAADSPDEVGRIVEAGADLVRLNAAHGDPDAWRAAIANVRSEAERRGRDVRVLVDLPGAGLRTRMERKSKKLVVGERLRVLRRPEKKRDVGLSVPEVLDAIPIGATVSFDDGRLEARVASRDATGLQLVVTRARDGGDRVRPDKGVGVPGVPLPVPAPTEQDLAALDAIAGDVDLVGLSFVRSADDVAWLQQALRERRPGPLPGILAKVETAAAIRELPEILVQGVAHGPFGAMIARGDLAVEVGFERLAEVQEELLWICEAAHVPVVWATQVLESLAKTGLPSRAEITDAAMAERAEIVMLNKGPFVVQAITALDDVLRRMEGHATKKNPTLRALRAWSELLPVAATRVPDAS